MTVRIFGDGDGELSGADLSRALRAHADRRRPPWREALALGLGLATALVVLWLVVRG